MRRRDGDRAAKLRPVYVVTIDLSLPTLKSLRGKIEFAEFTDTGRVREHNEDAVGSNPDIGLMVLADGMGGQQQGAIAAQTVIDTARSMEDVLTRDIKKVPAVFSCNRCGRRFTINSLAQEGIACKPCGSEEVQLISGRKYLVKSIEVI